MSAGNSTTDYLDGGTASRGVEPSNSIAAAIAMKRQQIHYMGTCECMEKGRILDVG